MEKQNKEITIVKVKQEENVESTPVIENQIVRHSIVRYHASISPVKELTSAAIRARHHIARSALPAVSYQTLQNHTPGKSKAGTYLIRPKHIHSCLHTATA
jgi:hypothetical protein